MVEDLASLLGAVKRSPLELVKIVHRHYHRLESHPDWLAECGVPMGLSAASLAPYLRVRNIVAMRDVVDGAPSYDKWIYISPEWDREHAIYLSAKASGFAFRDP